jgi:hypothetical protein
MSMDGAMGSAIGAIGPIMAVGLVAKVAQGTMKSVGNSYGSNKRNYTRSRSHTSHSHKKAASMHRTSSKKNHFSVWEGSGF